jgi:GH15 family glucan-1,4-alpha-glucosidase
VRIGNAASAQRQLDVYGAVVLAVNRHIQRGGRLGRREARFVAGLGRIICRQWRLPDQSIWEIRGEGRRYTYSAFMNWLALDCLLQLHEQGHLRVPQAWFRRERDAIREAIETRAFNETLGCYVDVLDGHEVDASLLLMACYGYHGACHPRMRATYDRIQHELGRNGLLLRYRPGYDGLPPGEGAFGLCSFWAVDNLVGQRRLGEAQRLFEHLLGFANDVGLYAEEIDAGSGEPLGNFPQAFTHVGLINAAVALAGAARAPGMA